VLDQFPDGAAIDEYAVEAMQVFVQAGIITGSDGMLAARSACSRGQIAQILRSILELSMT
ncbi:MAG: S-layer homology domain-containing protein, partial [Clostridiales bacterium]|nr:S-layer homology domain-containing protein [Clostridiales bacterium]